MKKTRVKDSSERTAKAPLPSTTTSLVLTERSVGLWRRTIVSRSSNPKLPAAIHKGRMSIVHWCSTQAQVEDVGESKKTIDANLYHMPSPRVPELFCMPIGKLTETQQFLGELTNRLRPLSTSMLTVFLPSFSFSCFFLHDANVRALWHGNTLLPEPSFHFVRATRRILQHCRRRFSLCSLFMVMFRNCCSRRD